MTTHRLVLVPLVALLATPTVGVAQSASYVLKGDSVAVYNLVGELRVEPASARGGDVTVELRRGGADAARLEVRTGPLRGRETLRVIYPDDVISLPDWGGAGAGTPRSACGMTGRSATAASGGAKEGGGDGRCGSRDAAAASRPMPTCG